MEALRGRVTGQGHLARETQSWVDGSTVEHLLHARAVWAGGGGSRNPTNHPMKSIQSPLREEEMRLGEVPSQSHLVRWGQGRY